jgi:hypothetical protein
LVLYSRAHLFSKVSGGFRAAVVLSLDKLALSGGVFGGSENKIPYCAR